MLNLDSKAHQFYKTVIKKTQHLSSHRITRLIHLGFFFFLNKKIKFFIYFMAMKLQIGGNLCTFTQGSGIFHV